jgi:hypothetical protein
MRNAAFFYVMMSPSTYEQCGPICEGYGRGFIEDDAYCRKVHKEGLVIACAEDVFFYHHLSASFSTILPIKRSNLFVEIKISTKRNENIGFRAHIGIIFLNFRRVLYVAKKIRICFDCLAA